MKNKMITAAYGFFGFANLAFGIYLCVNLSGNNSAGYYIAILCNAVGGGILSANFLIRAFRINL